MNMSMNMTMTLFGKGGGIQTPFADVPLNLSCCFPLLSLFLVQFRAAPTKLTTMAAMVDDEVFLLKVCSQFKQISKRK